MWNYFKKISGGIRLAEKQILFTYAKDLTKTKSKQMEMFFGSALNKKLRKLNPPRQIFM